MKEPVVDSRVKLPRVAYLYKLHNRVQCNFLINDKAIKTPVRVWIITLKIKKSMNNKEGGRHRAAEAAYKSKRAAAVYYSQGFLGLGRHCEGY